MSISKIIDSLNYNEFNNEKTCLMITGYNRPDYMKEVVESLNICNELENIPVFIFLDGGYNSLQKQNAVECSKIIFKNKFLKMREYNYGCERNVLNSIYYIFNELNFENIFILEDDLVVCKNYFKYIFSNFKKIKLFDESAGMFQGWNKCTLNPEEKKHNLGKYEIDNGEHLWGYLLTKETWQKILPIVDKYKVILDSATSKENFKKELETSLYSEICKLYLSLLKQYNLENQDIYKRYTQKPINPGQDEIIAFAMKCVGLKRYYPVVNRCKYIGKVGLHSTEIDYKNLQLDKVVLDIY